MYRIRFPLGMKSRGQSHKCTRTLLSLEQHVKNRPTQETLRSWCKKGVDVLLSPFPSPLFFNVSLLLQFFSFLFPSSHPCPTIHFQMLTILAVV